MMKMICISALFICFITEHSHPKKDEVCCLKHTDNLPNEKDCKNMIKNHVLGQLYMVSPDFVCRRDFMK